MRFGKEKISVFIFFYLGVLILPSVGLTQLKDNSVNNADMNKESFYIDPLVFYKKDSIEGRLDLYIELPLTTPQFKYNPSTAKYEAKIDYSVVIKDVSDKTLFNNTYSEVISNSEAEQKSIGSKSVYSIKQFYLRPDRYYLNFLLRDENSSNEFTKNLSFYVNDYLSSKLAYSNVMILSDYKIGSDGNKEITPLINGNVGTLQDFYIFFEILNNTDSIIHKQYAYRIYDEKGNDIVNGKMNYELQPGNNKMVEKIPTKNFIIGNFKLDIADANNNTIIAQRSINYFWIDLPVNIKDLDIAIDQLMYIATSEELSYIRKAKTFEERERRFLKFWKDKDANPDISNNKKIKEYYNRIKIANTKYSHYVDGWKTDMGMVYIIYGNPSNIDRHPFDSDAKPYEIWDYYDLNKRFIFVDYSGFGDYRLITPIYDDINNRLSF